MHSCFMSGNNNNDNQEIMMVMMVWGENRDFDSLHDDQLMMNIPQTRFSMEITVTKHLHRPRVDSPERRLAKCSRLTQLTYLSRVCLIICV